MLTPEEKAQELVNKMWMVDDMDGSMGFEEAKLCALVAVDEIQQIVPYKPATIINLKTNEVQEIMGCFDEGSYWEKVKQEIKKL
jgi:hypothetical protein